ncbi:MAG TPA: peptide MFS transporter [Victivallales bacterium]|nr:peptide MFS transporter [Victivallales bacterium]
MDEIHKMKRRQFTGIFLMEMWERFAFYSFNALFVLFAVANYFTEAKAYMVFGIFTALVFGLPVIGGVVADKIFGIKRSLTLGVFVLIAGYIVLALAHNLHVVYFALALIVVGESLFKPNPSALIGMIYKDNSSEGQSAFTYYYMAINIGAFVAPITAPIIAHYFDFGGAFWVAAGGMMFAFGHYYSKRMLYKDINNKADGRNLKFSNLLITIIIIILLVIASYYMLSFSNIAFFIILILSVIVYLYLAISAFTVKERFGTIKQLVGVLLFIMGVVWFISYNQMFSTLILFADHNVNMTWFGIHISPASFPALDSFWILVLGPFLAKIYMKMDSGPHKTYMFEKFTIGMLLCTIAYVILIWACTNFAHNGYIAGEWMLVYYFFAAFGELLVSALGLAVAAQYFPKHRISLCMGAWLLATGCSSAISGKLADLAALPKTVTNAVTSLPAYTNYFYILFYICLISFIIFLIISILLRMLAKRKKIDFA